MSQTFKLRLGDGTTMAVDHAGLRTWTADDEATVQTKAGWRPLREVLAVLERPPEPGEGLGVIRLKPLDPPKPPPSTHELATLRFRETPESEEPDDVYDEDIYAEPGALSKAWLWLQRLIVVSALAAGGVAAFMTWETWLPRAGGFGVAVLAEIDKLRGAAPPPAANTEAAVSAVPAREAAAAAAEQLPHLAPDTIELVMASSLQGVLDAPEVFRRAQEAAERGAAALSADEAQELRDIRQAVLEALRPDEREQMREYEKARTVRPTLSFEDRGALGSFAHGARSLPAARRQRLRALLGKAIAAGLDAKPQALRRTASAARLPKSDPANRVKPTHSTS